MSLSASLFLTCLTFSALVSWWWATQVFYLFSYKENIRTNQPMWLDTEHLKWIWVHLPKSHWTEYCRLHVRLQVCTPQSYTIILNASFRDCFFKHWKRDCSKSVYFAAGSLTTLEQYLRTFFAKSVSVNLLQISKVRASKSKPKRVM